MRTQQQALAFAACAGLLACSGATFADTATECTTDGFCYCINPDLKAEIDHNVQAIRARIADEKKKGKAIGYLSLPISTLAGSYIGINLRVAGEVKERVESSLGPHAAWILNTAAKEVTLPAAAKGPDYMLMWTRVLEGQDGLGEFDFVYFVEPSEFARHFGLNGHNDLEKLEAYYDSVVKSDSNLKNVDRRAFRDYYGLRASVAFSFGSHDEWNIVRMINERRREKDSVEGITGQMGVFYDGKPVPPGLFETSVSAGNAGECKK